MDKNADYDELLQIIKRLEMENERLRDENERLKEENERFKSKYEMGISQEELESMYRDYYSEDNETIHI